MFCEVGLVPNACCADNSIELKRENAGQVGRCPRLCDTNWLFRTVILWSHLGFWKMSCTINCEIQKHSRGKSCHLWLHKSLRKILRSLCSIYFTMVHSIFEYQFRHSSVGAWILIKYWLKLYSFYPWQKKVWKQTTVSNNSQKIIA